MPKKAGSLSKVFSGGDLRVPSNNDVIPQKNFNKLAKSRNKRFVDYDTVINETATEAQNIKVLNSQNIDSKKKNLKGNEFSLAEESI